MNLYLFSTRKKYKIKYFTIKLFWHLQFINDFFQLKLKTFILIAQSSKVLSLKRIKDYARYFPLKEKSHLAFGKNLLLFPRHAETERSNGISFPLTPQRFAVKENSGFKGKMTLVQ